MSKTNKLRVVNVVTVVFEPEGKRVMMQPGVTVLEAAKKIGVGIRSECGGKGTCGKCKVVIKDNKAVSKLTEAEMKHLSKLEIDSGYRLACQTRIKQNIVVTVPPESRIGERKIQVIGLERTLPLNPSIKKIHITLAKPTLSDVRPDFERLFDHLKSVNTFKKLEIDYELLKKLPDILRDKNWDVTVTIWDNSKIVDVEPGNTSKELYGFAVDIGTSKIVGYLVDLTTGKTISTGSIENPQIMHGEDIITRITFATGSDSNLKALQKLVINGINQVIHEACRKAKVNPNKIYEATVVGNTAMLHLFLAIQPRYLVLSPFVPAIKKSLNIKAKNLELKINPRGNVHVLPVIAGFVGADAVADALSTGILESNELSLLIDIGTNTEVFVGNSEDMITCSCASGPAFEGAHIKHGMKAVTGAIEKVRIISEDEVEYEVIGSVKPTGICGSAVIDIIAEMFKQGIIDNRGRFNLKIKTPRLRKNNKWTEFVVAWGDETATGKEITVTQRDINEILLAKAAIYTGCSILMKRRNVKEEDIDRVYIAGAFGSYINPENAKIIGLIPDVPTRKIKFAGNTAVTGAKMALISKEIREKAILISKKVRYLELTIDPDFSEEFVNALFIPNRNINRFSTVKNLLKALRKNEIHITKIF